LRQIVEHVAELGIAVVTHDADRPRPVGADRRRGS